MIGHPINYSRLGPKWRAYFAKRSALLSKLADVRAKNLKHA